MTMPYSPSRAIYEGNSAATRFPFSFKVWDASQLVVTLTSPGGLTTEASGWTANLGAAGGEIVYQHNNTPLPNGWKLAITRNMPFTQEVNLVSASRFDPQVIEDALDQATAERQQTLEMMRRAVILPATSSETPQDVVRAVYAARDNAMAAASSAGGSQSAAAVSAGAAAGSAATAAQTVAAATATAITAATAQASRAKEEADRAQAAANTAAGDASAAIEHVINRATEEADRAEAGAERAEVAGEAAADSARQAIAEEVDRATSEADRAKEEADRAQNLANIGPATADRLGLVKVGEGIAVQTDGTISVPTPSPVLLVCSTAASAAAKTVSLDGFALSVGATVHLVFANVNTAVAPTLNINGTGARAITCYGLPPEVGALAQGQVYTLIYSGSQWQIIGGMSPYPIAQYTWWEDGLVRPGFVPANGNIVANFAATWPQAAAYFSTAHGASRCFASLAQYEAAHKAIWATLADGSKVGWNNIGGVAKFWWDKAKDTLLMPDLTEMTRFMLGGSLGVADAQGDQMRRLVGSAIEVLTGTGGSSSATGVLRWTAAGRFSAAAGGAYWVAHLDTDNNRVTPTGSVNAPKRWGALICCCLGTPA